MGSFGEQLTVAVAAAVLSAILIAVGKVVWSWVKQRRRRRWLLFRNAGGWSLKWRGPGTARGISYAFVVSSQPFNYILIQGELRPGEAVGLEEAGRRDAAFWIQWTDKRRWFAAREIPNTGDRFLIGRGDPASG